MREIGSEYWDVPITEKDNGLFPTYVQWFLSGRSGLKSIIAELKGYYTVAMPSWCCDSMIKPFVDAGMEIHFYPVFWEYGLVQELSLDCDVLLLMDYFGYTSDGIALTEYKGVVIRDVTHSIFSKSYSDANYYFGSLRKWAGIWTGGYAWARDRHELLMECSDDYGYVSLRERAMLLKLNYLKGQEKHNDSAVTDKGYLRIFDEAESALEKVEIAPAAERDVYLAKRIAVEDIKARRRKNAEILRAAFKDWLIFPGLNNTDCPMFVPILVPDGRRNELRHFLIKNDIYCPTHWPISGLHKLDSKEKLLYDSELSLVCDQRYTEKDMVRIVNTVDDFWREA